MVINGLNFINYSDIRKKANQQGITDNKVNVGIWAQLQGYIKIRKQIDNKKYTYYYKPEQL